MNYSSESRRQDELLGRKTAEIKLGKKIKQQTKQNKNQQKSTYKDAELVLDLIRMKPMERRVLANVIAAKRQNVNTYLCDF